jgi:hypothetical protein
VNIVNWISLDTPNDEVLVVFGPSKSLPLWKFPARFTFERLPDEVNNWPAMDRYVQTQTPDYIIIDDDTARRRRQALSDYFQRDNELVVIKQIPPGWALDFVYPGLPCRWCVFSLVDDKVQPLASFDNGIQLLAQRTQTSISEFGVEDQSSLRVTLTWRAQKPVSTDYTTFVHLTAPDGFVKAQSDQQPFAGAHPTSHWTPGDILSDRYDIPLNDSVIPGEYLLLAGMYDPLTGERLAVTEGSIGPVPATVLLGPVEVTGE